MVYSTEALMAFWPCIVNTEHNDSYQIRKIEAQTALEP